MSTFNNCSGRLLGQVKAFICCVFLGVTTFGSSAFAGTLAQNPLFITAPVTPIMMLNMSKDQQLYFKAYDDYSDLDGDGNADATYKHSITYYGYFDSKKCYTYSSGVFTPSRGVDSDSYCNYGSNLIKEWNGNFLNWATMTRMDVVRKILYGGMRSTDTATETVLERAFLPNDAHSFAKYYSGVNEKGVADGGKLTPFTIDTTNATKSKRGITICNTTIEPNAGGSTAKLSQNVTDPPKMSVANGNYALWASNERWQCRWGINSNGNVAADSKIDANSSSPSLASNKFGDGDYIVRVKVCVSEALKEDNCKSYNGVNYKPYGHLQTYGENGAIKFGLMTGSYVKNKTGGVLRKNAGPMTDEIDLTNGTFKVPSAGAIIDTLNKLRIYGYKYSDGTYHNNNHQIDSAGSDGCVWGYSSFKDGQCSNWGNPQAEIYLESLRYLAGEAKNATYDATDSSMIAGLKTASWVAPVTSANSCAALNVVQFNASTTSYDSDSLNGTIGGKLIDVSTFTDKVGKGEGINGKNYFVGKSGNDANQLCTSKTVSALSTVQGTCPDAPRLEGSYQIAGLAYYAHINKLSPVTTQTVTTYGVALSPAVPKAIVNVPGSDTKKITILPACRNTYQNPNANCAIVDFKITAQSSSPTENKGTLYVNWEDSEQGGDYDQDMWGVINYTITSTKVTISTKVLAESTSQSLGFGYVIDGTDKDGFHVHSGVENFTYDECKNCNVGDAATQKTYNVGESTTTLLETPLYYAAKWGGFDASVDATTPNLKEKPSTYFFAVNPADLNTSLAKIMNQVAKGEGSASAVATNSTQLNAETTVYQARFVAESWSGQILAYKLDPKTGAVDNESGPKWDTSASNSLFPNSDSGRKIYTYNPDAKKGVEFRWGNLTTAQQGLLKTESVVNWVRGSRSGEGTTFRKRNTLLGDIVNSDPLFSGASDFKYSTLPSDSAYGASSYADFVKTKQNRVKALYIGSNDGMMHALNADTGAELFAYVPTAIMSKMEATSKTNYGTSSNPHQYLVDGNIYVSDVYLNGAWKTILVGSLGAGGKGIYVLDVTDPLNFDPEKHVLFEVNDTDSTDIGSILTAPLIVPMRDKTWNIIFGNGYESSTNKTKLFIVNVDSKKTITVIDTQSTGGLSGPSVLPHITEKVADYAYAGDLNGNLWKFNLTDASRSSWTVAYKSGTTPLPLIKVVDKNGAVQPITANPTLGLRTANSIDGYGAATMVYFGTGQYMYSSDVTAKSVVQSMYGIADEGNAIGTLNATNRSSYLSAKSISEETSTKRVLRNDDSVNWSTYKGWYLDLLPPTNVLQGERVISKALLAYDRVIFTTLIPSSEVCSYGGSGWLMEVTAVGDKFKNQHILDFQGIKQDQAVMSLSDIIKSGENIWIPTSDIKGKIKTVKGKALGDTTDQGRTSWRQLH
jgi:type IV pilus assembly protein PilY1